MHALVTGGGGFLGRYIVEQLVARGDRVRTINRGHYPELEALGVETVQGDVGWPDDIYPACEGIDCVFHTAALAGIWGPRQAYYDENVGCTEVLLRACRHHCVRRFVFTSSPSVTFNGADQCGVDERSPNPTKWLAYYPQTKAWAERIVLDANGDDGIRTCALRPHLIWGPRDRHLVSRLIARARAGQLRRIGDGTNLVDVTYVENAAEAHLLAADMLEDEAHASKASPVAGKAYFISQGEPVNCWQWIDEILALVDLPPVKKTMSMKTASLIGATCEAAYRLLRLSREPPMTRFLAAQLATSHWFDIGAARRDLGYQPRVSTAEGMRRLGEWLRRELSRKRYSPAH